MSEGVFARTVALPAPVATAFAYHEAPRALERLLPPWADVEIARRADSLHVGAQVALRMQMPGVPFRLDWLAQHTAYDPPHSFSDTAVRGPMQRWTHHHRFQPNGGTSCALTDAIEFEAPGPRWIRSRLRAWVCQQLETNFAYRHRLTSADLALQSLLEPPAPTPPVARRILLSGGSGLIGRRIRSLLSVLGHEVVLLKRDENGSLRRSRELVRGESAFGWQPGRPLVGLDRLGTIDAVIHLAGASIAGQRWSKAYQQTLWDSRVAATDRLARDLASMSSPPASFVAASAIGIYGDHGDRWIDETTPSGDTFLARLASAWEQAALPLIDAGVRVIHGRLGLVLDPREGALASLLPLARWGLGGPLGSGRQYWSWISAEDAAAAMVWLALGPAPSGAYNLVAGTEPQAAWARHLGAILHRWAILPAPAMALRIALGEMADALLLSSQRVSGERIARAGYPWRHGDLRSCLSELLGRGAGPSPG